jgi:hypothetical protein
VKEFGNTDIPRSEMKEMLENTLNQYTCLGSITETEYKFLRRMKIVNGIEKTKE